jgi:prevent-host-death family protein
MDKTYSIAEARNDLSHVVREAEAGRPVTLARRGRPVAMIVAATAVQPERSVHAIAELRAFRGNCRTGKINLRALIEADRR